VDNWVRKKEMRSSSYVKSTRGNQFHLRLAHPSNQTPPTITVLKVLIQLREHAEEHDKLMKHPPRSPRSSGDSPGPRSGELPPLRGPLLRSPLRRH
jgi:hypothetical protein